MIAANDVLCRVYAEIPSKTIGQIVLVVKILFAVLIYTEVSVSMTGYPII